MKIYINTISPLFTTAGTEGTAAEIYCQEKAGVKFVALLSAWQLLVI